MHVLPSKTKHIDTWHISYKQLKFRSNKLNAIAEYLGIGDRKRDVPITTWRRSVAYDKEAIKELIPYCAQDVKVQKKIGEMLLPLSNTLPHMSLLKGKGMCPKCAGNNIHARGYQTTNSNTYQRFQCQDCGAWSRCRIAEKITKPSHVSL